MKIKVSDLKLDESKIYTATVESVEFKTGNFGDYVVFQISTDFGNTNYLVNLNAKPKLIRLIYACGYDVNSMPNDAEIDLNELVGKKIGVKLGYSSEGYLRIQSVMRLDETSDDSSEEISPDDIFA